MSFTAASQREMLAELHRLAAERENAEGQVRQEFETATNLAQRELSDVRQTGILKFQMDRDSTQREYASLVARAASDYDTNREAADEALRHAVRQAKGKFASAEKKAKSKLTEAVWETNTVYEATQNAPKLQLAEEERQLAVAAETINQILLKANERLNAFRLGTLARPAPAGASIGPGNKRTGRRESAGLRAAGRRRDASAGCLTVSSSAHRRHSNNNFFNFLGALLRRGFLAFRRIQLDGVNHRNEYCSSSRSSPAESHCTTKRMAVTAPLYDRLHSTLQECGELRVVARKQARERAAAEAQRIKDRRDFELKAAQEKFDQTIAEIIVQRDETLKEADAKNVHVQAELIKIRDDSSGARRSGLSEAFG